MHVHLCDLVIVGVLQLGVAILLGVRDVLAQRLLLDDVRVLLARLRPRVRRRALRLPSLLQSNLSKQVRYSRATVKPVSISQTLPQKMPTS